MDMVKCKCGGCGHEDTCEVGSKCSMCGGDMKAVEEGGEMGGDMAGGDMPAEKPMDDMNQ